MTQSFRWGLKGAPTISSELNKTATLPRGFELVGPGGGIETISEGALQRRLLVTQPGGVELHELSLRRGETLTIAPREGVQESYYVLKGVLAGANIRLSIGDCLLSRTPDTPLTLRAEASVRLLYVSSVPTFWSVSQTLRELMNLAVSIEKKDGYTALHCHRLQRLALAVGKQLGLSQERLYLLDVAAFLHDVGKVQVPVEILQKPGPLSPSEWQVVRRHPSFGREMLEDTLIAEAGPIVEQHHERPDGSGYPFGLRGDEIMLEAHIVAITDAFDAMTTDRPYRRALPREAAIMRLERLIDRHYPKEVVEAFLEVIALEE